jgi:hypothetical protein
VSRARPQAGVGHIHLSNSPIANAMPPGHFHLRAPGVALFPFSFSLAGEGHGAPGGAEGPALRAPWRTGKVRPCAADKTAHAPQTAKGQAPHRRSILALSVPGAASSSLRHLRRSSSDKIAAGSLCPTGGFPDLPSPRLRAAAAGRQIPLRLQDRLENTAPHRARRRACIIYAIRSQCIM